MPYASLRDFIDDLERAGELVRVAAPVSPHLEMTEIQTRLLAEGGPAVLFENVVGEGGRRYDMPVLVNLFGTVERVAWGMDREPSEQPRHRRRGLRGLPQHPRGAQPEGEAPRYGRPVLQVPSRHPGGLLAPLPPPGAGEEGLLPRLPRHPRRERGEEPPAHDGEGNLHPVPHRENGALRVRARGPYRGLPSLPRAPRVGQQQAPVASGAVPLPAVPPEPPDQRDHDRGIQAGVLYPVHRLPFPDPRLRPSVAQRQRQVHTIKEDRT